MRQQGRAARGAGGHGDAGVDRHTDGVHGGDVAGGRGGRGGLGGKAVGREEGRCRIGELVGLDAIQHVAVTIMETIPDAL